MASLGGSFSPKHYKPLPFLVSTYCANNGVEAISKPAVTGVRSPTSVSLVTPGMIPNLTTASLVTGKVRPGWTSGWPLPVVTGKVRPDWTSGWPLPVVTGSWTSGWPLPVVSGRVRPGWTSGWPLPVVTGRVRPGWTSGWPLPVVTGRVRPDCWTSGWPLPVVIARARPDCWTSGWPLPVVTGRMRPHWTSGWPVMDGGIIYANSSKSTPGDNSSQTDDSSSETYSHYELFSWLVETFNPPEHYSKFFSWLVETFNLPEHCFKFFSWLVETFNPPEHCDSLEGEQLQELGYFFQTKDGKEVPDASDGGHTHGRRILLQDLFWVKPLLILLGYTIESLCYCCSEKEIASPKIHCYEHSSRACSSEDVCSY